MFGSGMSIMPRALSFCSLLLCTAGALAGIQYATLYWASEKTIKVKGALDRNGDAYGFYNDTIQSTGWGVLEIRAGYGTRVNKNNNIMFAAGYLEGYLTARHMYNHFANLYPQLINNASMQKPVEDFLWRQYQWTKKQITVNQDDPFWRHAGYVIAQLDGLHDGAAKWAKLHAQKVLPGFENVLFAHSSWYTYASTLRIYKHWDFNISDANTSTGKMSFSSYPGFLESLDDFYLLGSGLVMLQTTNSIFNKTLFEYMVPEALFTWQRVRIANMMADSGTTWALTFSRYNSGTYNSQYMILDWKKIKLEKSIDKGTLTIVEQVPTLVVYSDQTSILRKDYRADPYAKNNSCNTICCRGDLVPVSPSPFGCYDSKVADITLASQFTAFAINGPTVEDGLPAFRWSRFNETVHQGLPEVYNFSFVKMKPIL